MTGIDWGYTGRAVVGERRCRKCRTRRDVVVRERTCATGYFDEVMCVACGLTWSDYGGWSPQTWCRPKPGHEAEWSGNPNPDTAVRRPLEPMTDKAAAWVREHAWTPQMHRQPYMIPGTGTATYDHALVASICDCMVGVCHHCKAEQHEFCDGRKIKPRPEWWIANRPLDYIRPTAVWYADRACRSLCPCCPDGPPRRLRYETVPLPGFDLFAEVAA